MFPKQHDFLSLLGGLRVTQKLVIVQRCHKDDDDVVLESKSWSKYVRHKKPTTGR